MGTTASTVSSAVTSPITFSGVSTYSRDFQSILQRAVSIASLPLTALQNSEQTLIQQKTQLSTFGGTVTSLSSALTGLTNAVSIGGISATSSNPAVLTATASGAASAATYTINSVTSLAKPASETSNSGFADSSATQVSATGALRLVVGSKGYNINLSASQNNLAGLQKAINSLGVGVSASILTTGTGTNSNYLSVSANANGKTTLQLFDAPTGANTNLLTSANQGTDAVFQLNNITVDRQSNNVNDVIPGVSFSLLAPSTTPVTVSLNSSSSALSSALSSFVSAYNTVADQVTGQVGQGSGLLNGNSIVAETASSLRQIASYGTSGGFSSAPNAIQNLSDLGVTFDAQGHASFNATALSNFNDNQLTNAFAFIGSATIGFGSLVNSINQLSDPVTGLIKIQQDSYDTTDTNLQTQISDLQTRIGVMQKATTSRLEAMDALVASLQSQQQVITASIQSVNLALFGKNTASG